MYKRQEVDRVIALTEKYADQILTVTPPDNPRAMHAYDLATEVAKVHPNVCLLYTSLRRKSCPHSDKIVKYSHENRFL